MKVIHFIASIDKIGGGTTAYMQLLATQLKDYIELVVVTGNSPNPVKLSDIKVQFINLNPIRWFSIQKEFRYFLETEKPDIVHINGIWTPQNWLFQKEAQRLGIKVILSPHGMLEPYILRRHPLKKKIALALYQNQAVRNANYLHATAQSELNQIQKLGYNQTAAVIPNGIDLSEIQPKTNWGTIQNILFLSRVHPKKGIEILIETIAQLMPNSLKITIAGEGDPNYIDKLKKQTQQKGVSQYFDFIGSVYGQQKWTLYKQADLFVLPTYSENFGIVVAEALATGIPVITTTGTPWQELETHNCGWWVDISVENLILAITEAISTNSEELREMGLRGRKLVEEKYDIRAVAFQMNEIYKNIINN